MGKFADNEWFEIEHCYKCGMAFAMTLNFQRRRLNDREMFYCPAGHAQHYVGKSEAQKLKDQLASSAAALANANQRAARMENERNKVAKAHRKMRTRVANGVCPCCNRSFQNLREHMQTKHADFGSAETLRALRVAFGMTQADVANEAHVKVAYVSLYERGKPTPVQAVERLDWWRERQGVA